MSVLLQVALGCLLATSAMAQDGRAQYDEYGQEIRPSPPAENRDAPVYLIAMKGSVVYAASWYQVGGGTLRFMTVDHERKETPLAGVDRGLTLRLNRQRGVKFEFPQ